jgi:hypothetical protein
LSVTLTRRVRVVAALWGLLFAANVLLSPALCQQFRQGPGTLAGSLAAEASDAAHSGQGPRASHATHHGQHGPVLPSPSAQPSGSGAAAHPDDASCEFCLLTSVADTAWHIEIAAPAAVSRVAFTCQSRVDRAAVSPLPLIRAPPVLS